MICIAVCCVLKGYLGLWPATTIARTSISDEVGFFFFFFLNSFILISLSTTESYYYIVVTVFKAGGEGRVNYSKGERAALAGRH